MHGEELRGKSDPSVTELLAKRASQIAGKGVSYVGYRIFAVNLLNACALGFLLAKWD